MTMEKHYRTRSGSTSTIASTHCGNHSCVMLMCRCKAMINFKSCTIYECILTLFTAAATLMEFAIGAWERSVPWNNHMAHVDEETGRVDDYSFVPDSQFVQ